MGAVHPDGRFALLARAFAGHPGVTLPQDGPRRFGSTALKVDGSIFAMLTGGRLVVKLPRDRVDALVAAGTGRQFDGGKGRPMREWMAVATEDDDERLALAREALDFVGPRPRRT